MIKRCKGCKKKLYPEESREYNDSWEGRGFCSVPCNLIYLEKELNKLKKQMHKSQEAKA